VWWLLVALAVLGLPALPVSAQTPTPAPSVFTIPSPNGYTAHVVASATVGDLALCVLGVAIVGLMTYNLARDIGRYLSQK